MFLCVNQMLLIQNGTLISSEGKRRADILIDDERIVEVAPNLAEQNVQRVPSSSIVDATGLLVFPGLIDIHTHLREPGGEHKEDFYTGTCAALAGGVTTVFAMPNTSPAVVDEHSLEHTIHLAQEKAVCDFGIYLGATNTNSELKKQTPSLRECGLKIYMGSSTGDLLVEDFDKQYAHFANYPHERVIAVHAEHEPAVRFFAQMGMRRPPICAEIEAARAVAMAEQLNRRLHVCHVSTIREVEIIAEAKSRGVPVTCEFSPHHLFLTSESSRQSSFVIRSPSLFEMNPPLRANEHAHFLWKHLDIADCIATDHAPHTLEEKQSQRPPMGMPGLETMLPLLLTAAHQGKLQHEDISRLCCEGPARAFAIPHKGKIATGFDADLTLIDPNAEWIIGERPLFTKCDWTAFEGWKAQGSVKQVYLRGRLAFEDGKILCPKGFGREITGK